MARQTKLYIYDRSSEIDRDQASGRFSDDGDVFTIGIDHGILNLKKVFEGLVGSGYKFNHLLFQTHGSPGRIWFGNESVTANVLKSDFVGFTSLFPHPTRIYFDGCNVAEGGDGTNFLLAAGNVFLVAGGGETLGWTTLGHGVWGRIPIIGGHTLHFGGENTLKRVRFFRGGAPDFPDSWLP
jgi:hypothetical protein